MPHSSRIAAWRLIACLGLFLAVAHAAAATSASERLACYDAAFPPVAGAMDAAAERDRALREFGLNKTQLRERDPARMRVVAPDRIEASIARLSVRPTGERVVTLDSGQIWLLTEVTMKGHGARGGAGHPYVDDAKERRTAGAAHPVATHGPAAHSASARGLAGSGT